MMITFGAPARPRPASGAGWDAAIVFERFTERARGVVVGAQDVVRKLAHPHIATEHLLLGELAVGEGLGAWALESLGLGMEVALQTLAGLVPPTRTPPAGQVPFTVGAGCALELSVIEVQSRRLASVNTEHLLLGICAELDAHPESDAAGRLLHSLGVTTAQVRAALEPDVLDRSTTLSWSLRLTPELEFRDLPGSAWAELLPLPADLRLRRLLVDSAAVALDAGRHVIESSDLMAASGGVRAGVAGEAREWESVEAGRPVLSALVGAARIASGRGAEAVTVEDLLGSLRFDQRVLLGRAGWPLEPAVRRR
jgi:hypothetical protein